MLISGFDLENILNNEWFEGSMEGSSIRKTCKVSSKELTEELLSFKCLSIKVAKLSSEVKVL